MQQEHPTAKDQTVSIGKLQTLKVQLGRFRSSVETISSTDTSWSTTAGEKDATDGCSYPDGSKDEVPVKVTVKIHVPMRIPPQQLRIKRLYRRNTRCQSSIGNVSDLPSGTIIRIQDTSRYNDYRWEGRNCCVTYPDGPGTKSQLVTVKDPRTDADKNTPTAKDQTVKVGDTDAKNSVVTFPIFQVDYIWIQDTGWYNHRRWKRCNSCSDIPRWFKRPKVPVKVTVKDPRRCR